MSFFWVYLSVLCALLSSALALFSEHRTTLERTANGLATLAGSKQWPAQRQRLFTVAFYPRLLQKGVFGLLALSGLAAVVGGLSALLGQGVTVDQLAFGLPWLHRHVRLDSLSGFFGESLGSASPRRVLTVPVMSAGTGKTNARFGCSVTAAVSSSQAWSWCFW